MAKCEVRPPGKTIIEFRYTERQNVPFICATPFCPFTLVEVSALATPELLVEIEAIAHIGKGGAALGARQMADASIAMRLTGKRQSIAKGRNICPSQRRINHELLVD